MRMIHALTDVSMSLGHDSLRELLIKRGVKELGSDQCAVFINKRWHALKLLLPNGILIYLRRPVNKPIDPATIKYLPECVNGAKLEYGAALEKLLEKHYKIRVPKHEAI